MADEAGPNRGFENSNRPTKRLRTDVVYPRGTIKCVRVKNFMTYGDIVEIVPGPRLNLVLGPNGTGKSSLVCALCVGLAGSAKLLGRADNVKEYIKRGCEEGWVETTLSGGPGLADITVRRDMKKTSPETYTSTWRIDSRSKLEKDVKALVSSLNIQFDNLCQFLPQDKVVEFARMDPYELLLATEKAIGDASMYDKHQQLIAKREEAKVKGNSHQALTKQVESAKLAKEKLERDYERFRRKEELQRNIQTLHARDQWVRVDEAHANFVEAKGMLDKARKLLDTARAEAAREEGPLKQVKKDMEVAHNKFVQQAKQAQEAQRNVDKLIDKQAVEEERIAKIQADLESLKEASDLRISTIDKMTHTIAQKEAEIAALPPVPDHGAEIAALNEKANEMHQELQNLGYDIGQLDGRKTGLEIEMGKVKGQMNKLQNERFKRLQMLDRRWNGIAQMHETVEDMKRQRLFLGEVYGPLGVEMNLKDSKWARFLEMSCSRLQAWTASNQEDEKLLSQTFRARNFQTVIITTDPSGVQHGGALPHNLKQLGVLCTLDEVYDAPVQVKAALRESCGLHRHVLLENEDPQAISEVLGAGFTVYTPNQRCSRINSAYGGREDATDQTEVIKPAQLLGGQSAADLEQQQADLDRQMSELQQQLAEVEEQRAAKQKARVPLEREGRGAQECMQKLRVEMQAVAKKRKDAQAKLVYFRGQLAKFELAADPLLKQPALQKQLAKETQGHLNTMAAMVAAAQTQWAFTKEALYVELRWRELEMQSKALAAATEALRAKEAEAANRARMAASLAQSKKAAWEGAKAAAQREYPLTQELQQAFQDLPSDREEIAEAIAGLEGEMAAIVCNNPRVLEEYKEKQRQLEQLTAEWDAAGMELEAVNAAIQALKEEWLPELNSVVAKINDSFSTNFSHIGCAGEVVLEPHEDFDKYAIEVRVKFREGEELQKLTATRQSGGERSVSTILYLIALQGVTVTPFRVVDEINQGMDPINERKVFRHLVEASTAPGTPQCFLLTPKLLPDLTFTKDVTVLQLFNGPLVAEAVAKRFTIGTLYGRRLQAVQGAQQQQQEVEVV